MAAKAAYECDPFPAPPESVSCGPKTPKTPASPFDGASEASTPRSPSPVPHKAATTADACGPPRESTVGVERSSVLGSPDVADGEASPSTPHGLGNETEELARGLAAILADDSEESISLYDRELPTEPISPPEPSPARPSHLRHLTSPDSEDPPAPKKPGFLDRLWRRLRRPRRQSASGKL